jgi:hypothetical protein
MPDIEPVLTARQRRQFIELPYRLYAHDPHWVPPLRREERRRFSRRHNPFLEHATIETWLAIDTGRVVGRIAAIDDRLYNDRHGEAVTWFGFFEARDEPAAMALLAAVEAHARDRGSRIVRGPVNPSLNESAGFLVDRFEDDPYVLMPYNPASYPSMVEAAGYRKTKDLLAWRLDATVPLADRIVQLAERAGRRDGLVVRTVDRRAFDRDLEVVQRIYRTAWQGNWAFVPPTDAEIRQLALALRPLVDPELVLLVELKGQPVACVVAIPDANQLLKRLRGRLFPFGLFHFARRRRIITRARVLLLGVMPGQRHNGLYPLLISELHRRGRAAGYQEAELSWTLEDNDAINAGIEAAGAHHSKTYRLYDKPLG